MGGKSIGFTTDVVAGTSNRQQNTFSAKPIHVYVRTSCAYVLRCRRVNPTNVLTVVTEGFGIFPLTYESTLQDRNRFLYSKAPAANESVKLAPKGHKTKKRYVTRFRSELRTYCANHIIYNMPQLHLSDYQPRRIKCIYTT